MFETSYGQRDRGAMNKTREVVLGVKRTNAWEKAVGYACC